MRREQTTKAAGDLLAASSHCSRCGAPVVWVKTVHGKNLPLEPEPSDNPHDGNFALRDGVAVYVRDDERMRTFSPDGTRRSGSEPIYIPHFAVCAALT